MDALLKLAAESAAPGRRLFIFATITLTRLLRGAIGRELIWFSGLLITVMIILSLEISRVKFGIRRVIRILSRVILVRLAE